MWMDILKKQYTIQDIKRYIDVFEHRVSMSERWSAGRNTLILLKDVKKEAELFKEIFGSVHINDISQIFPPRAPFYRSAMLSKKSMSGIGVMAFSIIRKDFKTYKVKIQLQIQKIPHDFAYGNKLYNMVFDFHMKQNKIPMFKKVIPKIEAWIKKRLPHIPKRLAELTPRERALRSGKNTMRKEWRIIHKHIENILKHELDAYFYQEDRDWKLVPPQDVHPGAAA